MTRFVKNGQKYGYSFEFAKVESSLKKINLRMFLVFTTPRSSSANLFNLKNSEIITNKKKRKNY